MGEPLEIGGVVVPRGSRQQIDIPVARLPTSTALSLPVEVVHGARSGPILWLSAALHGDELNGVEIIREVLAFLDPQEIRGTIIAVPIVNVFGFIEQSRYLPDRRDLNRSFPGAERGSLAARLAHLFMKQIVNRCTHGVDLHTGSNHRTNLPQIRGNLRDDETLRCAVAFGAPIMIDSQIRDGSLRQAATELGSHVLLYEAGEALRFDSEAIDVGVKGVMRLLRYLKMRPRGPKGPRRSPLHVRNTSWVRARRGGILRLDVALGDHVARKQRLGTIAGAFGDDPKSVTAPNDGLIIGLTKNPLVNQGDGIIHLARINSK